MQGEWKTEWEDSLVNITVYATELNKYLFKMWRGHCSPKEVYLPCVKEQIEIRQCWFRKATSSLEVLASSSVKYGGKYTLYSQFFFFWLLEMICAKQSAQALMYSQITVVCTLCQLSSNSFTCIHFPSFLLSIPESWLWELLCSGFFAFCLLTESSSGKYRKQGKKEKMKAYFFPSLPDSGCFWQCQVTPFQGSGLT